MRALVHSDQYSQHSGDEWLRFCRGLGLVPSVSRRGNCWDNAVAEWLFSSRRESRITEHIYRARAVAAMIL